VLRKCNVCERCLLLAHSHVTFIFFVLLWCRWTAGPDQHCQVFELVWGGFQVYKPIFTVLFFIILTDEIKHCQSKPASFLLKLTKKSNEPLRGLNCCFKPSFLSGCPRQTSGRLVLMFTNRTRWQSSKRAILESLTAACVSAGKHTDTIHWNESSHSSHAEMIVFFLLCVFCYFALVIQCLVHTHCWFMMENWFYDFAVLSNDME